MIYRYFLTGRGALPAGKKNSNENEPVIIACDLFSNLPYVLQMLKSRQRQ